MTVRLSEAERKTMNVIWENEGICAKDAARLLGQQVGWSKTTVYTMLSICIEKGYLRREDPKFHCWSRISREEASLQEAEDLIETSFSGSVDLLLSALVGHDKLSREQLDRLLRSLDQMEDRP